MDASKAVDAPHQDSIAVLTQQLDDPTQRRVLIDTMTFASLMRGCAIDKTYTIPDTLASPIRLTEFGKETLAAIKQKAHRHKPNDLKFALFMEFGCPAGTFVDPATDMAALRSGLSAEMQKQKVLFPYIFGRELHDRSAEHYPEKSALGLEQTISLLKSLPSGVFQEGYTTTGPFGCVESFASRLLPSTMSVPGYFCSDAACTGIHRISLSSATNPPKRAPANKSLQYVSDFIHNKYGGSDDGHARLMSEAGLKELGRYSLDGSESIMETIADGLSLPELRIVAEAILRKGLREHGKNISLRLSSVINNPAKFTAELSTAHLLQLILIFPDQYTIEAVDSAVSSGAIVVAENEMRSRRIARFGDRHVHAEIGQRGLRVTGSGNFVARRLMEMIQCIYYDSDDLTPEDLAYLVGATDLHIEEGYLLDYAIRRHSPETLLRDLVIGNRRAVQAASKYLHISLEGLDKEALLQTLLWKLGASTVALQSDLDRVEKYEVDLTSSARSNSSQDEMRAPISNLFAALEGALRVSLEFATWTLTNDHFLDDRPFVYDPAPRPELLSFIEENSPTAEEKFQLSLDGRNSLAPLGAGFSRLAKAIQKLKSSDYLRTDDQVPAICRQTDHPFAFRHTVPFFDLSTLSQEKVLAALNSVSRLVQDEVVLKVRNGPLHGDAFPSHSEIGLAVEKVAQLRGLLAETGFYPTVFKCTESVVDELGRTTTRYESGAAHMVIYEPSWAIAPKMPPGGAKQVIAVPACDTVSSGPIRFALIGRQGDEKYWAGWPRRWSVKQDYGLASADAQEPMATGTAS